MSDLTTSGDPATLAEDAGRTVDESLAQELVARALISSGRADC